MTSAKAGIPAEGMIFIQVSPEARNGFQIDISGTDGFTVGRSDSKSNYVPDIDLAAYQALNKGVSRRHAALVRFQQTLHVVDLNSANGTFLNGKKLPAELAFPLNHGDQLKLGELALTIFQVEE
jgi:pSer/pThr/pTyr-binding forkhead associated (FHA) protein